MVVAERKSKLGMEGRVSEEPKSVQAGIDSSREQMGEGSDSERKRVEKNDVSGEQSGVDASHGQMGGGSESNQAKRRRVRNKHVSGYSGVVGKYGVKYAKMALKYYEKSNRQDAKFKLGEVLFSTCAWLVVPGYKGAREWCHLSFTAEPINFDASPKRFFGELVLDHASGIHRVTHCSMFDPTEPGLTYGCEFCPSVSLCLHPPDGYLTGDLSCVVQSKCLACRTIAFFYSDTKSL